RASSPSGPARQHIGKPSESRQTSCLSLAIHQELTTPAPYFSTQERDAPDVARSAWRSHVAQHPSKRPRPYSYIRTVLARRLRRRLRFLRSALGGDCGRCRCGFPRAYRCESAVAGCHPRLEPAGGLELSIVSKARSISFVIRSTSSMPRKTSTRNNATP